MGFMEKLRVWIARFMTGRYGADHLGVALLVASTLVSVIGSVTGLYFLRLVADAFLVVSLFRMFSRDRVRRMNENSIFLTKTAAPRRAISEAYHRYKNRHKYHYYACPKCKQRLRVPRGAGHVTITCRSCGEKFDKDA